MEKDCLKTCYLTDNEEARRRENDGYVKTPVAEVPESSIRRSTRLKIKKSMSSCSQYAKKSSKATLNRNNYISGSKIGENNRNENNSFFSVDSVSMKSSTTIPSFKYHVRSKDGISLVVDLNLKRSDWLKSMQKEVCACRSHQKPEFGSFRKEVESLGDKKNTASDASTSSFVGTKFSIKSVSREIEKSLHSVVEKEVQSENIILQENCGPNKECVENVTLCSEEIQFSDNSNQQKGSSCSRNGNICSENVLTTTFEVNQETDDIDRQPTDGNKEGINSTEETEVLPVKEENAIVIYDGAKSRKRNEKCHDIHGQSHERILRNTKLYGARIIEHDGLVIRRSSRLFSKAGGNH